MVYWDKGWPLVCLYTFSQLFATKPWHLRTFLCTGVYPVNRHTIDNHGTPTAALAKRREAYNNYYMLHAFSLSQCSVYWEIYTKKSSIWPVMIATTSQPSSVWEFPQELWVLDSLLSQVDHLLPNDPINFLSIIACNRTFKINQWCLPDDVAP